MKNLIIFSVATAAFIISGCSSRAPMIDTTSTSTPTQETHMSVTSPKNMGVTNKTDMVSHTIDNLNANIGTVYFNFNKFNIRPDMQPVVASDANLINSAQYNNFAIKLEGNCDEFGSDEYNYALGLKRAKSVKDSLATHGVNVSNITIVSYGKTNPVCTEQTKACYAKNRRVNFKFLP